MFNLYKKSCERSVGEISSEMVQQITVLQITYQKITQQDSMNRNFKIKKKQYLLVILLNTVIHYYLYTII